MASKTIINPLTGNDATAKVEVGTVWVDGSNGKAYRYVQAEDANLAVGDVVEYADATGAEVTKDRSGGSSIGRAVAGVAIGTITDAYYGWIQVSGLATVKTDGAVVKGDALVPHASVDGVADTATSASTVVITAAQVFGYALATDTGTTSAGTVAAMIRCL
jgi:hypothetical protein